MEIILQLLMQLFVDGIPHAKEWLGHGLGKVIFLGLIENQLFNSRTLVRVDSMSAEGANLEQLRIVIDIPTQGTPRQFSDHLGKEVRDVHTLDFLVVAKHPGITPC